MKIQLHKSAGFSKPLAITSLAAIAGFALFGVSQKEAKGLRIQVTQLTTEVEQLKSERLEPKELKRLRGQEKEIERLKKDTEEVYSLRGEVTQLRAQKSEFEKLRAQIEPLQAAVRKLSGVEQQNAVLQQQQKGLMQANSQFQNQLLQAQRAAAGGQSELDVTQRNQCIAHLKQIDGATQQWGLEHRKVATSPPEVAGILKYLKGQRLPVCPSKGTYIFPATVAGSPQCSVHGKL